MGISNFSHGFRDAVTIRGATVAMVHPGKVIWVNNSGVLPKLGITGSNGNDGTYLKPFATVQYAISVCLANRNDIIMVMPGHVEAVTATSLNFNVAGVSVFGLGEGDLRPLFTFAATTSTITISAANCALRNVILKSAVASVVAGVTLSANGFTCDIETRDGSSSLGFVSGLVTTSTSSNHKIEWKHRGVNGNTNMVRGLDIIGVTDAKLTIDFFGQASTAVVNMRTTACNDIQVDGKFYNLQGKLIYNVVNSTTSTWSVDGLDEYAGQRFSGSDQFAVSYVVPVASMPLSYESAITTLTSGANTLFTISGGPI